MHLTGTTSTRATNSRFTLHYASVCFFSNKHKTIHEVNSVPLNHKTIGIEPLIRNVFSFMSVEKQTLLKHTEIPMEHIHSN